MAMVFADALRNARANQHTALVDAGPGPGLIRVYDGIRPVAGGAVTTLLAELVFGDPSFPVSAGGVRTANPIGQDPSANANGTATWFREVDSVGTFVADGDVGLVGTDMIVNSTSVVVGLPMSITSYNYTEGNA